MAWRDQRCCPGATGRLAGVDQLIAPGVHPARQGVGRELLLDTLPAHDPVDARPSPAHRVDQAGDVVGLDQEPGLAVDDDLGRAAAAVGDHRHAARHRLDRHVAERLDPLRRHHDRRASADRRLQLVGRAGSPRRCTSAAGCAATACVPATLVLHQAPRLHRQAGRLRQRRTRRRCPSPARCDRRSRGTRGSSAVRCTS